jgi:CBS domain-containing protein
MASTSWVSAIITGLLFFVSILLHELTHAAVAKLRRIPVRAITLFALGGVAQIEKDAADAKSEFWMGVIGPITSVVIGLFCLPLATVLGWNFCRRGCITPCRNPYVVGIRQHCACCFQYDPRLWRCDGATIPNGGSNSNIQTFVQEHLLPTGHRCFVVTEQGSPAGIITPHEVKALERVRWPYTTVGDVMRSLESLRTVSSDRPVTEALEMMGREDVNQMPVVQKGKLEGIISRAHIIRVLQTRAELDL